MELWVMFFLTAGLFQHEVQGWSAVRLERAAVTSDLNQPDDTAATSDVITAAFDELFSDPQWRDLVVTIAPSAAMTDEHFRFKWNVTHEDDRRKERLSTPFKNKLGTILNNKGTKSILIIGSTKEELMDPIYRDIWDLGEFSESIFDREEGGNFFDGPQFHAVLELNALHIGEDVDDERKAMVLGYLIVPSLQALLAIPTIYDSYFFYFYPRSS